MKKRIIQILVIVILFITGLTVSFADTPQDLFGNGSYLFFQNFNFGDNIQDFRAPYSKDQKTQGVYVGDIEVKRIFTKDNLAYTKTYTQTYHINGQAFSIEVPWNEDALSWIDQSSLTPSGWTFVGWRTDDTASSEVFQSYIVGQNNDFYAVYSSPVTLTYTTKNGNHYEYGQRYYNNGNITNPTFMLERADVDGFTFTGYRTDTQPQNATNFAGDVVTLDQNTTFYAIYERPMDVAINKTIAISTTCNYGTLSTSSPVTDKRTYETHEIYTEVSNAGNTAITKKDRTTPNVDVNESWDFSQTVKYGRVYQPNGVYILDDPYNPYDAAGTRYNYNFYYTLHITSPTSGVTIDNNKFIGTYKTTINADSPATVTATFNAERMLTGNYYCQQKITVGHGEAWFVCLPNLNVNSSQNLLLRVRNNNSLVYDRTFRFNGWGGAEVIDNSHEWTTVRPGDVLNKSWNAMVVQTSRYGAAQQRWDAYVGDFYQLELQITRPTYPDQDVNIYNTYFNTQQ